MFRFFRRTVRPEVYPLIGAVTIGVSYGISLGYHNMVENGDVVTKFDSNKLIQKDDDDNYITNPNLKSPRFVQNVSKLEFTK